MLQFCKLALVILRERPQQLVELNEEQLAKKEVREDDVLRARIAELDTGRSILDAVADQVHDLERSVGSADRVRLDQYFTSVRELENRLQQSKGWERKPKPVVQEPEPQDPASVVALFELVSTLAF